MFELAANYRQVQRPTSFDLVCYRKYSHNEDRRADVHAAPHVRGTLPDELVFTCSP
jgi:2-oxoglutarate dehydrogenase complex dehydrogenase (E1) component-like enzyme